MSRVYFYCVTAFNDVDYCVYECSGLSYSEMCRVLSDIFEVSESEPFSILGGEYQSPLGRRLIVDLFDYSGGA